MCEEISIPPYFRCPISLDLFKDPVTLWTGQTYDRPCIQKWLAAGNSTCPVTMQKLHDSSMVPNHTLRHLIHQWLHSNGFSDALSENQMYIARIKHIIQSESESESELERKILALEEVHSLSQELPIENSCLIELDFFEILVEQVFRKAKSFRLQEKALSCVLELMRFSELKCLNILKQEAEQAVLVSLLRNGTGSTKKGMCVIIEAISMNTQTKDLCEKLGQSAQIVRAIVRIVEDSDSEASEAGIRALAALSSTVSSRENMVMNGAMEGLVACLSSAGSRERSAAMAAIERLLTSEARAREIVVSHPEGVRGVVKMVFRVSEREGSSSAVNSLLIVCAESESGREKAIVEGVLTQLLLLLQSQSSDSIKTKARMLLNLLRSHSGTTPIHMLD